MKKGKSIYLTSHRLATSIGLRELAQIRINESKILLAAGMHSGAHYLAGYAIEFAIKSIICKKLDIEMFDETAIEIPREVSKPFKIHNLNNLMMLSGLHRRLKIDINKDEEIAAAWTLVSRWNEHRRYEMDCDRKMAIEFIRAVEIVLQWIKKHW